MGTDRPKLHDRLSGEVAEYLNSANHPSESIDLEAIRPVCATIEFLLSGLLENLPEWQGQWIDGILPRTIATTESRIRLFGEAILVVTETDWTLRPMLAELSLGEMSVIRLADSSCAIPYTRDRSESLEEPSEWPHFFVVDLTTQ